MWKFQIFYWRIIAQILVIWKVFTIKGATVKVAILSFSFKWNPSTQKIRFYWAPLFAFPNVWFNFFKFCFLNICCNFRVQNLGHDLVKATWSGQIYLFFAEKWDLTFEHFFGLKNALMDTLTYSAMTNTPFARWQILAHMSGAKGQADSMTRSLFSAANSWSLPGYLTSFTDGLYNSADFSFERSQWWKQTVVQTCKALCCVLK